jgi:eukaryotic-like serine/threonine-protein kinase
VFEGNTAVDVCIAHVTKPPTPPSQVAKQSIDPALEAIIMKCLEKNPADRYAGARELRAALLALPQASDWSVAQARTWWSEFRVVEQAISAASDGRTQTLPVDLQHHRETFRVGA